MEGLVALGVAFLLVLFLVYKALRIKRAERRLLQRLVPVPARVTRQTSGTSIFVSQDANGNRTERLDTEYEATYEYRIGGQRYEGRATASSPLFGSAQLPPNEITVYCDRDDPSVSRLYQADDGTARNYLIFAAVVAVVGLLIALIANADRLASP